MGKITDKVGQLARTTATRLGIAVDDSATWQEFRKSLEAGDDDTAERLRSRLGIGQRHCEFARLCLRLDAACEQAKIDAKAAQARIEEIDTELGMLHAINPTSTKQASELAERIVALRKERHQCFIKAHAHEATAGVRSACPELWGLDATHRPYAGLHIEALNFAQEHLSVNLYSAHWLESLRPVTNPPRRVKVKAAGGPA